MQGGRSDYQIYLAAPWFTPDQERRITLVEKLLDSYTTELVSPRRVFICPPGADASTRKRTFIGNLDAIKVSEMVVAITDDKDLGTIWEMGYAFRVGIPSVAVALTLGDRPFNLMLAESCVHVCKSITELKEVMDEFHVARRFKSVPYQGEII